jgi:hypothetical protein
MKYLVPLLLVVVTVISFLFLEKEIYLYQDQPIQGLSYKTICKEFQDSSLTRVQIDSIWKKKYQGKRVAWVGKVEDVDQQIFGSLVVTIDVNMGFSVFFPRYSIITVNTRPDFRENVLYLKKGQKVRFAGNLSRISNTFGCSISLEDGEINWIVE